MTEFEPGDPDYADVVRASFAQQGLMQALGIELAEIAPGACVLEVAADPKLAQQHGYFHGALIGAMLDCAGGYAALSLMPPGSNVLTTEYKINFLTAASGARLVARGRVIKHRHGGGLLPGWYRRRDPVRGDAVLIDSNRKERMNMLPCQRHLFDLPKEIAYLNCAYMSPLLTRAVEAGAAAMAQKARPWAIKPADFFGESERARALFAQLLGASAEDIALIPAASYGLAVAAANLPVRPGQRILVLAEQFPSNVYTWNALAQDSGGEVVTIARPEGGDWTRAILEQLDERVAIAALPHCHWTDGGLVDLAQIGTRCREVGSALVLDVTQSLGALPLDLSAVRPDFLICPGYKWLLGPYSLGYLYVAPQHQAGRPLEQNWIARENSEDFARLVDYRETYQPGARRFDVGERSNFALMPASIVGLEQLLEWGIDQIALTLAAKTADIAERAEALGLRTTPSARRAGHFLGLRFPEGVPPGLLDQLAEHRVYASVRGDSLRVTPHVYNDDADVDRLFAVLKRML